MPQITGQDGRNLTSAIQQYLNGSEGSVQSEELVNLLNEYLQGGDRISTAGGNINNGIFKKFGEFDTVSGKVEVVTTGLWTGDTGSLTTFFTSSTQVAADSGDYYYNIYNSAATSSVQFAVAYGHVSGSGSVSLANNDDAKLPTKATYNQYRTVLLDQTDALFTVLGTDGTESEDISDIYVLNIARARYKEQMDAGNWSLKLSGSAGVGEITLIDNSGKKFSDKVGKAGRVFDVVSGSLNLGTDSAATVASTTASNGQGFGKFYPDQGLIILNPTALSASIGVEPDLGVNENKKNHGDLYDAIVEGGDFEARRTENVSTSHYFVRATNREFNYSNNPTFISGSDNSLRYDAFKRDPKVFITSVGLYNDSSELLAIAKTSQPIQKSFDKEVLIKVKLDF
jgi:hypothetical protein